jgi:hypothetical protein
MRTEKIKGMFEVPTKSDFWKWHRKRKRFLIFPKTIGNEKRWWEIAEWEEVWQDDPFMFPSDCGYKYEYEKWMPIKWINA